MGSPFGNVMGTVVANLNTQSAAKYQNDLAAYNGYVQDWLASNSHARDIASSAGQTFVPTPVPNIPQKVVYSLDANTNQIVATKWQDPAIKNPVLPPPVAQTGNAFAGSQPNLNSQEQDASIAMLSDIQGKVDRIIKALNIP